MATIEQIRKEMGIDPSPIPNGRTEQEQIERYQRFGFLEGIRRFLPDPKDEVALAEHVQAISQAAADVLAISLVERNYGATFGIRRGRDIWEGTGPFGGRARTHGDTLAVLLNLLAVE